MSEEDLTGHVVDQDEETPIYEQAKKAAQKREEDK